MNADQKSVSRACLEDIRTFKIALYKDITMDKEVGEPRFMGVLTVQ